MFHTKQVIPLAAVFQYMEAIYRLADEGQVTTKNTDTAIHSLFALDANTTEEVYNGIQNLIPGYEKIIALFSSQSETMDPRLLRHLVSLLHLQKKISKRTETLAKIKKGIEAAQLQSKHFSPTHENVIASVAEIYSQNISILSPRILINGEQTYLSQPRNIHLIRTYLFSALRALILWRQLGGSRLHFLLKKKEMVAAAKVQLKEAKILLENP